MKRYLFAQHFRLHDPSSNGITPSSYGGGYQPRSSESEGFEEKYRAVINGGNPEDEQVGQRWGKIEPALWGRTRYSFTHRTKVFADGTIRTIHA
jgi:hypothetical protein